jgi:hypothetical protein
VESSRLCPVCGAYWKCDCKPEDVARVQRRQVDRSVLNQAPSISPPPASGQSDNQVSDSIASGGCNHDWSAALGVEVDEQLIDGEAQVLVCRLCGLYSVEERSA